MTDSALEVEVAELATDAVGARALEQQHRDLLEQVRELVAMDAGGAPKAELLQRLRQLQSRTLEHFELEELHMQAVAYPRLEAHRALHADISAALARELAQFERGGERLGNRLVAFLEFWLVPHIKGFDRARPSVSSSVRLRP